jgi:two-component system cell cycle sensor histidine kinase/response regulator CckA
MVHDEAGRLEQKSRQEQAAISILVADDEEIVRDFVAELLNHRGYEVLVASNATAALNKARMHDGLIHLVLTDYEMGAINGCQLATQLMSEGFDVKVLIMSGRDRDEITLPERAQFIQKPFAPAVLLGLVSEMLSTVANAPERLTVQREQGEPSKEKRKASGA